jgi:hypothetical protein
MAAYQQAKYYPPLIQVNAMRAKYPQFKAKKDNNGDIVFTGDLQVKPELPVYTVKIIYHGDHSPRIYILDPVPVASAPHIYPDTESLCLYHPKNFKWQGSKLIADDIMGWTAGWIYFYEYWLQTGTWIGPEVPHNI